MKSIIGTMAVLLLLAGSVMAAPAMTFVDSFNPVTQQLEVVLIMNSNGDSALQVKSFGAGLTLTGAGAANFTSVQYATRSAAQVAADTAALAPAGYAFIGLDGLTNSNPSGPGIRATYGHGKSTSASVMPVLNTITAGKALAVWFFNYTPGNGTTLAGLGLNTVTGTFTNDAYVASPTFSFANYSTDGTAVVASNNVVGNLVPEPATMALLGLGLVGLIARRKK